MARAGSSAAVDELFDLLLPRVRAQVHRRLAASYRPHNGWIAAVFSTGDVVQDLALGMLRNLPEFRGDTVAALTSWISSQIEHRIVERLRYFQRGKRDRRRQVAEVDAAATPARVEDSPEVRAESQEILAMLATALGELPDDERALLEQGLDPELSWAEVAIRLRLPGAEAARQRHKRARSRLCLRLARLHPELFLADGEVDHGAPPV
ncbi:MAG: sigma-70 family RNA polymerase sigma factor [Planctomycetes bacterium]|nr:sigma-70 family RNA polymerase sigma factor [Planctomycetota bacterium]